MPNEEKPQEKQESRLVDLFTCSRELEDLIISQYPGKLFENQHHVDTSEPERLYCFYEFDYATLNKFLNDLKKSGNNFEYELRDSKTGDFLDVNKISQLIGPVNLN